MKYEGNHQAMNANKEMITQIDPDVYAPKVRQK